MPSSTTTLSTSHPTKRQNRSITTFPATPTSTLAPLPGPIQASLQTVGMRVRKSVASGYKTKTTSFPALILPSNIYSDLTAPPHADGDQAFVSLPSSQESVPGNGLKRGHEGDEEEEEGCEEVEAEQHHSRSAFDLLMANRHVAIPKAQRKRDAKRDARRRGWHRAVARKDMVVGGAGVGEVGSLKGVEDFGDADFLRPVGEVEMDVDV